MNLHDDNFGHWDSDVYESESYEDALAFYNYIQRTNVTKVCMGCQREVEIQPQYSYCDSCATARENGWEY